MRTTRLRVSLRDVEPPVVRVLDVPSAITLDELHEVLQIALGWTNSHLHRFDAGSARYGVPSDDWDDDDEADETGVPLSHLPARFTYVYDFGDWWEHDVEVIGRGGDEPTCVDGEGACPPEDSGGAGGYLKLRAALFDQAHEQHAELRDWVGDRLRPFDHAATARRVRDVVGRVPESVRLVLDLLADGVKLTPGGRLPRHLVRTVQDHRPQWYPLGRPASIEDDLVALSALHDLLRDVGLVRLSKSVLRPTRAAADEAETVRRLRRWFPPSSFRTILAERAVAMLAAHGELAPVDLASAVLRWLGPDWRVGSAPLTVADVHDELHRIAPLLEAVDLVGYAGWRSWSAGPSARSLLPGATALADVM